jgi:hypothetical protein
MQLHDGHGECLPSSFASGDPARDKPSAAATTLPQVLIEFTGRARAKRTATLCLFALFAPVLWPPCTRGRSCATSFEGGRATAGAAPSRVAGPATGRGVAPDKPGMGLNPFAARTTFPARGPAGLHGRPQCQSRVPRALPALLRGPRRLGDSLTVELSALDRAVLVRIQVPQPAHFPDSLASLPSGYLRQLNRR